MPKGNQEDYRPDFFGSFHGFPFIVSETKLPDGTPGLNDLDTLKTFCMMKLMLDQLIDARVEDAEVIGLLFLSMSLFIVFNID